MMALAVFLMGTQPTQKGEGLHRRKLFLMAILGNHVRFTKENEHQQNVVVIVSNIFPKTCLKTTKRTLFPKIISEANINR
jgi:hypothetical protein